MATESQKISAKEDRKTVQFEEGMRDMIESARAMSPEMAVVRAKRDIQEYHDAEHQTIKYYQAGDIGLRASNNIHYRAEIEKDPDVTSAAKRAISIGEPLGSVDSVYAKSIIGTPGARVLQPKVMNEYAGPIVMQTQTHLVQQTGRNSVVAHDIRRLEGTIPDVSAEGKIMKFVYGSMTGKAEVLDFTPHRQAEIRLHASELSAQSIKSPQAKDNFRLHVEKSIETAVMHQTAKEQTLQRPIKQSPSLTR
ncbi:KfrB domain-containing protein [Delftia sp. GW456-R20]|uniref:KfrB domain-containing protein n=1 Tax=Delftia sp. GW456-R20 TaxID=1827145 RepID=UPI000A9B54B1|nr:hypothetical protein [Delftia sp. GW456-R20]